MLKMLDLFSGIGGFSLAADWTGCIETVAFCEIEPYCQKVLKKHWPDVPIFPDIKELRGEDVGPVDIVCGGFPCQPFSCAGKQRAQADDRHLWPEMFRIIQETKPTWVIGENVAGLIDLALEDCFVDLEAEGYEVQPLIIPACAVDAPHRRDRVWIMAHSKSLRSGRGSNTSTERWEGLVSHEQAGSAMGSEIEGCGGVSRKDDVANTDSKRGRSRDTKWEDAEDVGQSSRCTRSRNWDIEPDVGRVANGVPSALDGAIRRLKLEDKHYSEAIAEVDRFRREILFNMWSERQAQSTPLEVRGGSNRDCLYQMPYAASHERWNLGQRIEKDEELCGMWQRICSAPFKETQDLQSELLVRIREAERNEKVASSRVSRLRALGNSIVPQIAFQILQGIVDIERSKVNEVTAVGADG